MTTPTPTPPVKGVNVNADYIFDAFEKLIVGAMAMIAALAWNEAFKSMFDEHGGVLKKFGPWMYAVVITFISIIVTVGLAKAQEHAQSMFRKDIEEKKSKVP